jgi:hypothetical protein
MTMVLSNSRAFFERLIENVLGNLNWKKCLCFLDDLIIFGADFDTALQNRREVFERLKVANLKLKAKTKNGSYFKLRLNISAMLCPKKGLNATRIKLSMLEIGQNQNQKLNQKFTLVSVDILENLLRFFRDSGIFG